MSVPKIEAVDFGGNCGPGVCFLHLICFWFYVYVSLLFSDCFYLCVCLLVRLLSSFFFLSSFVSVCVCLCDFVCLALLLPFVLEFCTFFFFFLFFWAKQLAVSALWLGVRPEPLRWESWVQDVEPPETFQPHVILIRESSPRDLHLNTKTQFHSRPASSSAGCPMPNN